MAVVLKELLGNSTKISVLEELIGKWGEFLTLDEISEMSEVPKHVAHTHIVELQRIGILKVQGQKYKLDEGDRRTKALLILENDEEIRIAMNSMG
ncbi:hypothetical protein [Methanobacterium aggregans]|uniref:hypothetical protein n=1 Tax=Methanobacterium aggregans TaxID=1615586 RepID=UPI001AE3FDFC|nr:hypothetical protein [Methanobacterium aggregans]MBP2044874.1 putative Rmd1/YagE family protein [Methanobacterium aggregans]